MNRDRHEETIAQAVKEVKNEDILQQIGCDVRIEYELKNGGAAKTRNQTCTSIDEIIDFVQDQNQAKGFIISKAYAHHAHENVVMEPEEHYDIEEGIVFFELGDIKKGFETALRENGDFDEVLDEAIKSFPKERYEEWIRDTVADRLT